MGSVDPKNRGAVLLVDDEEDLRSMVRDILEAEHYFVLEAEDGIGALEVLRTELGACVRLIILDLLMPCMSGWELVDILRRDPQLAHIPVLVTSGLTVHGDASGIGATMSWIRKPFGVDALLAAVSEAIEQGPVAEQPEAPRTRGSGRPLPSYRSG
jgi:CheY-like chemotaxis protein